jgi:hypothetical protein
MKKQIVFLLWICLSLSVLPQSNAENIRKSRPLGVAANLGGGSLLGVSVDYFIIPQLNIEAGVGLSQYIALKYHFAGGSEGFSFSVEGILGIVHYKQQSPYDYNAFEEKTQLFPSFGIRLGYHFNTSGK